MIFSPEDKLQIMKDYIQRGRGHAGGLVAAIEDLISMTTLLCRAVEVIRRNRFLLLDDPEAERVLDLFARVKGEKP